MEHEERQRLLSKRAKLQALADRGIDGEKDNARRMLAQFDARHPELIGQEPHKTTIINNYGRAVPSDEFARTVAEAFFRVWFNRRNW